MNHIDPEDFEWHVELNQEKFNNETSIIVNSSCGLNKDDQYNPFVNTHILKQETIENKCYTSLDERQTKLSNNENSLEELRSFSRNYSEDALNCLYRSEEQSIDLNNVDKQAAKELNSEDEYLSCNKLNALISNSSKISKADCFNNNSTLLNAETISLISNSISGEYEPPESFSFINYKSNEQEQIVPIRNQKTFDEHENPQALFNVPNQNETIFIKENTSENNKKSNSPLIKKENFNPISSTTETSSDGELLGVPSLLFEGISAYTPGGQCYKLPKRIDSCSKAKADINKNQLEIASLLNVSKKIRQIQKGVSIPEQLDYNKEEDFNNWLREEKDKIKSLFENFDINLNIKHLEAERELIKLDRYLKQYAMSDFLDPLEILEYIEKMDIDLTNLVFTHQVYETISKITKNCKGRLRTKSRAVLMKLKSLLSSPKGIKDEKYLNELLIINNVGKLKPDAPAEWILHLLTSQK